MQPFSLMESFHETVKETNKRRKKKRKAKKTEKHFFAHCILKFHHSKILNASCKQKNAESGQLYTNVSRLDAKCTAGRKR